MASRQDTVDYILDQVGNRVALTAKRMFGEFGIYCQDRIVAFVADDLLYFKPTDAGRKHIGKVQEGAPYPGAKAHFLIPGDRWEDGEWLAELFRVSAMELPLPAAKKKKTKA